jgi:hypothetical protein
MDMGYIPEGSEWFVAELVMEITVRGATRNIVHRNLTLIAATDPETAYQKALSWGQKGEVSYDNPSGHLVEIRFKGLSRLDVVIDPLADGAELTFQESIGVTREEIARWVLPKERLEAFKKPLISRSFDPDYRSSVILDRVSALMDLPDRKQ